MLLAIHGALFSLAVDTRKILQTATFEVGKTDCVLTMCDHVYALTGIDPAAAWRGTYNSEAGATAICAPYGGLLGFCDHMMWNAGFVASKPADQRPIVCELNGHEFAGVMFGNRCGFLLPRGLLEVRADCLNILRAWKI